MVYITIEFAVRILFAIRAKEETFLHSTAVPLRRRSSSSSRNPHFFKSKDEVVTFVLAVGMSVPLACSALLLGVRDDWSKETNDFPANKSQ